MKYLPYNAYKPSPFAWLDQMPEHWDVAALRWMSRRYAGGTPDKGNEAYWEDGDIPWINSGAVNDGYITEPSALITREGFANSSAKWIPKDALVMALAGQGKTKGLVAQLGIETTCNQSMAAIIPDHRLVPRYLFWWLSANYQNIRNLAGGEARDGLNLDMLGSIQCPLPLQPEQQAIARFLDAKTAQIDTLVAKKRQLIDKLKEKRSALIARTVTRGLPTEAAKAAGLEPNPEMKDSGVEWLGEIPAHWLVMPLFRMVQSIQTGPFGTQLHHADYVDDEVPLINPIHLVDGELLPDSKNTVTPETVERLSRYKLLAGDLVFARRGDIGRCGVVRSAQEGWLCGTGSMVVRLKGESCSPLYYALVFRSSGFSSLLELNAVGTTMLNLNPAIVGRMLVPVPPLAEQQAIIDFLDRGTAQLDALTAKVETAITRLTEYRQALITSAVTGKIDVRNYQTEKEAA